MNVSIGGIAKTVEITSFDKLGDVKVCMLTTTADGSVGFEQLNDEVRDTIYASFPVDTASGDIASFEDGADNVPVRELKLNLEPYQNLNGYDHPWVGGAGKNKWEFNSSYSGSGYYAQNLTFTVPIASGTYTLSFKGTVPSGGAVQFRFIYDDNTTVDKTLGYSVLSGTYYLSFTFEKTVKGVSFIYSNNASNAINNIQLESGSSFTTYAPYENICPIYPNNGKNLYNSATKEDGYISATGVVTVDGSSVHSALIPVTPNQPIVFSGKTIGSASSSNKRLHGYDSNGTWVQQLGHAYVNDGDRYTISATVPSGITGVKISFRGTDEQVQVEHGKVPSAYVPYNAIGITRTGKNLLSADKIHRGIIGDKTFTIENSTSTVYRSAIIRLSAGSWTFTFPVNVNLVRLVKDGTYSVITNSNIRTYTINTTTDDWVGLSWRDATSSSTNWNDSSVTQLEKGSASTGIEPYTAERYYPISDNPVYGGTLEVETGLLTVTHNIVDLGTLNWTLYSVTQGNLFRSSNLNAIGFYLGYDSIAMICSNYPVVKSSSRTDKSVSVGANNCVDVIDSSYSTTAAFKTAMNGVQLVYELATPLVYQLTPVQVKTLLGYNNIWTDSGTVEVQYRANIGLYIQKIIGATEDDMVANQNISANKYFFVGEELYYSTSAISAGQTIVVGTNCIKTNLADALNALNS